MDHLHILMIDKKGQTVKKLQIATFWTPRTYLGPSGLFGTPGTYLGPLELFGTPWIYLGPQALFGTHRTFSGPPGRFRTPGFISDPLDYLGPFGPFETPGTYLLMYKSGCYIFKILFILYIFNVCVLTLGNCHNYCTIKQRYPFFY